MKQGKLSEAGLSRLKDEQDLATKKILPSSNPKNINADKMKQGKLSEAGLSGLKDGQDLVTKKILPSSNPKNLNADNMKQGATLSLPKGWEIKKLGEVCRFINGRAYSKAELLERGNYPVLRVGNFFTNTQWYYSDLELDEDKYCDNGDLLYAWSASFGPRIWEGEKVIYHYHIWKVIPDTNIVSKEFLFQLLNWDTEALKTAHGTGTTMMHVGKGSIEKRLVPIPPLPEQQRIVSILDKAFAAIDKAKANAEQNLKNAKELFESYLQEIMSESGYAGLKDKQDSGTKKILKSSNQTNPDSDKWEVKKLGEVAEIIGGGTPAKNNQKFYEGNIYWATVRDMKSEIITDTEFKINEDAVKKSSTNIIPKNNVIIATRVGLGKICKIQNDTAINQDLRGIIPKKKNQLEVDYLFYWFKSIASQIIAEGKGATVQGVTLPFIKGLPITLPPLKEQQTIVRQLDALRAETQKLEAVYQQKIANLEELKKSILQKAFAGELRGGEPAEPKTEKSRRDARIIENKINQTQPNPEGVI
jgi:type I restriction enzyme S subunit